jgi:hypothetical protein
MKKTFVIYDNIKDRSGEVYQRLLDLDQYYHYVTPGWHTLTTTDLDETLINLAAAGQDFVVVSALGHYIKNSTVKDSMIDECGTSPLVGHIIDRNGYYSIDPQFFALDLKVWKSIGAPRFNASGLQHFDSVQVLRSKQNIHDDYTPLWLKPGIKSVRYQPRFVSFGWAVIRALIEHQHQIANVAVNIRNLKVYLYPNDNRNDLTKWIANADYVPTTIPLKRYAAQINDLFDQQSQTVYVQNSEGIVSQTAGTLDHYTGVCGGLKAVAILFKNGFHNNTKIDLFDVSAPSLEYQKYLVTNWNGDFSTYRSQFDTFRSTHPEYSYAWRSWNSWDFEIDAFLSSADMTPDQFKQTWNQYQQLDIQYTCIDLLDHVAVNSFFTNSNGRNYVWVSNAYNMEHTIARYGARHMQEMFAVLTKRLCDQPGEVWIEKDNYLIKLQ